MHNIQYTFARYEKKYLLRREQYEALLQRWQGRMRMDAYGRHTVCSLYYDTPTYQLIRASLEKPPFKEKLRLRGYGHIQSDSAVFLEVKRKAQGVVYKRRALAPLTQWLQFMEEGYDGKEQICKELAYTCQCYDELHPSVLIACERTAYSETADTQLRVTFDFDLRWRNDRLDLRLGDEGERLLEAGEVLMEIKAPYAISLWLCDLLNEMELYPISFSKYGTCYRRYLCRGWQQQRIGG